jgi:dGTPase
MDSDFKNDLGEYSTSDEDPIATSREIPLPYDGFRNQFERDYTRILHSRAFRRMRHKTQVFIRPENDHICTRLEHSLYLASIAKTIAKKLRLNVDLVQAIALGHDLGHAPFGHEGEKYLHELGKHHGIIFKHELHSLRVVDETDSPYKDYKGLNLTFAVRDGIVCHNGESFERILQPDKTKRPEDLKKMNQIGPHPATMEGCVVRFADKIAYIGRDLEDALNVKIIIEDEIPSVVTQNLGLTNREIINVLIRDLVENSMGKDHVCFSDKIFEAFVALRDFNYDKIYKHEWVTHSFPQISQAMTIMFDSFASLIRNAQYENDLKSLQPKDKPISYVTLSVFLEEDIREWTQKGAERLAIDFMAGMTDNFFIETYKDLFLPRSIV